MNPRKRLAEILARMGEIKAGISEVEGLESPTDEDATRAESLLTEWDTLEAERVDVQAKVDRLDAIAAASVDPQRQERTWEAPQVMVRKDPFADLGQLRRDEIHGDDMRERAITAMADTRVRGVSDQARENATRTVEDVDGAAVYALAHGTPAYVSAYKRWLKDGGQNVAWTSEEREAIETARNIRTALNITTGSSGQYSLPTLFDPSLIHTGTAAINPIRQIARVERGTQNVWHGVSTGNVATYWHAESAALTDGSPTLAAPVVTAGMLTAYVPMSYEFYEDSSVVAQLPGLIGEAFDYAESTAFVSGSGTNQPLGVVTAISATAGSTVTATTRGASSFTSASSADVFAVANAMPSRYEGNASWIAHKKTFNIIRQMSPSGAGSLFWGQLGAGVVDRPVLLGSPAYNSSDVVATQTTGTVILVLGDFSQYLIYDRIGINVEFVQNVVDGSGLPIGQRALIAHKRVGANTTDINAFRFLLN